MICCCIFFIHGKSLKCILSFLFRGTSIQRNRSKFLSCRRIDHMIKFF